MDSSRSRRPVSNVTDVSKSDDTQWPLPKLDFYWLCKIYSLYYDDMLLIAEAAGVSKEVIHRMFLNYPVKHSEAVAVLEAFSQHVGRNWTMDTVKVLVLPEQKPESTD